MDPVNHPSHYQLFPDGTEAIDIIKAALTPEEFKGYCKGNALKYRLRAGKKDALEQDIAKANTYVAMMEDPRKLPEDFMVSQQEFDEVNSPKAISQATDEDCGLANKDCKGCPGAAVCCGTSCY